MEQTDDQEASGVRAVRAMFDAVVAEAQIWTSQNLAYWDELPKDVQESLKGSLAMVAGVITGISLRAAEDD